jgi:hypothetical protein
MTAIVGIINKKGIAIAADSASTTKNKIINSGNKMLRLSDIIPAAIMVVNNSTLATIPWEVIIRWYRKENGKIKFPSLQSCIDDFLAFVDKRVLNIDGIPDEYCEFDEEVTTFLVFAGYGENESMPHIYERYIYGIDHRKLMHKSNKGFELKSEDKEVIIYAQGQPEIIKSYIHGVVDSHVDKIIDGHITILKESIQRLAFEYLSEEDALLFDANTIPIDSLRKKMESVIDICKEESEKEWLQSIKDYNLQKMASLAENLIKATELRKKIMNEAEEVGGLIDLAVISKNDGFQWLNRKSWYDPSRGGQYGKFGI